MCYNMPCGGFSMKKSSIMTLPDIEDVTEEVMNDESVKQNIRTLLINGAMNVVENTILKNYISKDTITQNINKYTKDIKASHYEYVGSPSYGWTTLHTSPILFSKPIRNAHLQNSNLTEYPELIKLLEIIGLTTAVAYSKDDQCFIIGTQDTKYEEIKSLIANYFATSTSNIKTREINFAGRTFNSKGVSNCLQVNMISVIAKILGEEELAKILISEYPEKDLAEKINEITKKKNLGEEIVQAIIKLNWKSKQLMGLEALADIDYKFYKEKLQPFIFALEKQGKRMQMFITSFLERNNYDIEDYIYHHGEVESLDVRFSKEDIEYIQHLNKRFSEHWQQAKAENTNFPEYFYSETPEVKPRDNGWHEDDFTFVNKAVTEMNIDISSYNKALNNLDNATTTLINLFSEKLIPYAMKNKRINLNPKEFEEMLILMTYQNSDITKSKKGTRKVEKVKKKIERQNKKH